MQVVQVDHGAIVWDILQEAPLVRWGDLERRNVYLFGAKAGSPRPDCSRDLTQSHLRSRAQVPQLHMTEST